MQQSRFLNAIVLVALTSVAGAAQVSGAEGRTEVPAGEAVAYPRALIFGRVVDLNDKPLAEVGLRLGSVGERWVSKDLYPEALTGFRTVTDADGAFRFDVPVPTSSWTTFSLRPSEFHTRDGRDFGMAGGRDEEPLREGDNDLGTFVLANAGVIAGRIVDLDGAPISGAHARLERTGPGGYTLNSNITGADGVYRIGHIPAGRRDAESLADGFVSAKRTGIEVVEREVTAGVDFILHPSPSISGRVLDASGQPLESARVRGWPVGGGMGARAESGPDGRFTLLLPEDARYELGATRDGFEELASDSGKYTFEPGTDDAELVMHRARRVTFVVRDTVTEEPITQFGLKVIRVRSEYGSSSSSSDEDPAAVSEHPDGTVELPGDPRWDDYTIVAPGYGDQRADVDFDEGGGTRQTIRLATAGSITGRLVHGGEPVAGPTIRLRADRLPLRPGVTEGEDDIFSENWGPDLDQFAGRKRQFAGADDGTFLIEGLAPGTYAIRLSGAGIAPTSLRGTRVEPGETTTLGEIEAFEPGTIRGQILLADGFSPGGLSVAPGGPDFADDDKAQMTDARGRFGFTGLAQGTHYLWVEAKPGVLVRDRPTEVELGPGETKALKLDLSERIPCELEVHVLINGEPAVGAQVAVRAGEVGGGWIPVGVTDSEGMLIGYVRGAGPRDLQIRGAGRLIVGESSVPIDLRPAEQRRVDLVFDAGRLSVSMAASMTEVENPIGIYVLVVQRVGGAQAMQIVHLPPGNWKLAAGEARADLGLLAPGTYSVRLNVGAQTLVGTVEVTLGGEAVCVLAE